MGKSAAIGAEQQHLRALEYANRVRLARARLKRRIAAGELSAAEVVLSCPWQAHSMSVSDLLMSQKRWGRTRCRRLLLSLGVPENKQLGTLTERQRGALAGMLGAKTAAAPEAPGPRAVASAAPAAQAAPVRAAIPPDRAAIPPDRAAIPPERAAIPPERAAIPPERAAIPPERAAISSERAAIPSERAAIPPERAAIPPERAAIPSKRAIPPARAPIAARRALSPV